ncbi:MAG: hypothetical protein ACRDF4_07885 [Rhabdochlamydiaceae bacterium]
MASSICYFEREGRQNLADVLHIVKRAIRKHSYLRSCKLIIFTAMGEGPALAYNRLKEYDPKIIAVTFPPGFTLKRREEGSTIEFSPQISDKLRKFFDGVGVTVLTGRLPFDGMDGADSIKHQMKLIKDVLSLFGGGFALCVQAVLQACDTGAVRIGEKVIAISGDCAAIMTASTTAKFLSAEQGLSINEILCKPSNLSLTRKSLRETLNLSGELFQDKKTKLLPPL